MGDPPRRRLISLQNVVDFIFEADKLKGVLRKTRPLGLERHENSAEHSWQIALLAASLEPYAVSPVRIDHDAPAIH